MIDLTSLDLSQPPPREPPAWVKGYIGLPFFERGRTREGCDCWGLPRLVYFEQLGIPLPSCHTDYERTVGRAHLRRIGGIIAAGKGDWLLIAEKPKSGNCPLDGARLFDLVLMKSHGEPAHIGMIVARNKILHIGAGIDATVSDLDTPFNHPSVLEIRRHRALTGAGVSRFSASIDAAKRDIILRPAQAGLNGEILAPGAGDVLINARPRPFAPDVRQMTIVAGATVEEIVAKCIPGRALRRYAHVEIGDEVIPRELWARVRPKPGTAVTVRAMPGSMGGGARGQQKNPLRTLLSFVVVVLAAVATWYVGGAGGLAAGPVAGAIAGAAVAAVGTVMINMLVPPASPDMNSLGGGDTKSPTLSLQGTRNSGRPYQKIPRAYGRHKRVPDYGAIPFTEIRQSDQWLRLLFDLGYGPQLVEDLKIGTTPLANYEGVDFRIHQGWPDDDPLQLVGSTIKDDGFQILMDKASGWVTRTTRADTDGIMIEVDALQGMTEFDDLGNRSAVTVEMEAEYRRVGATDWLPLTKAHVFDARVTGKFARPKPMGAHKGGDPILRPYTWHLIWLNHITGDIVMAGLGTVKPSQAQIPALDIPVCAVKMYPNQNIRKGVPKPAKPAELLDMRDAETIAAGYFEPSLTLDADSDSNTVTIGAGTVVPPAFVLTFNSVNVVRKSTEWPVPRGQYDVRLRRTTADTASDQIFDKVHWTLLRSISNESPIRITGHTLVEMVLKASNELQGLVDSFNCVTTAIVYDYDGVSWDWRPTRNATAAYVDVLTGTAAKTPLADDRVDWAGMEQWAIDNIAAGRNFDGVFDYAGSRLDALKAIASAARASFGMKGGLYSVIQDKPQSVPVQHFTPRNSWGFSAHRRFPDAVHGLKLKFENEAKDWDQDEIIVYDDGYDETNATAFAEGNKFGITNADQVWKAGRYDLAVQRLRPWDYTLYADVEYLEAQRGSLVTVGHDVILVGLAYGRIKSLTKDEDGNVTGLTVDEALPMAAGTSYGIAIRTRKNKKLMAMPVTVAGSQTSVTLATAIPYWIAPAEGDLFTFGEAGRETIDCIVSAITPQANIAAKLMLVDAAPAVHEAELGPIPAFDAKVTLPKGAPPPKPAIARVVSDETVLIREGNGSLRSRILIELALASGAIVPPASLMVTYGRSGSGDPLTRLAPLPGNTTVVSIEGVQDKVSYDIFLWAVSAAGAASGITSIIGHVVVGKSTPPPDVPGLMREADDAVIDYPVVPLDMAGYLVRANPGSNRVWETAAPLHPGVWGTTRFPLGSLTSGTWTILVKAVDVAGNQSENAAAIVIGLGDPEVENLVETIDLGALGWPGTISNGMTVAGLLQANDSGDLFWPADDNVRFWAADPNAAFWQANWQAMSYVATIMPDADQVPATLHLEAAIQGANWSLEYRPSGSQVPFWHDDEALFWPDDDDAAFWPEDPSFLPWPGALPISRQPYEIRVRTAAGDRQGQLSSLTAIIDMPDIEESFDDVAIEAGGTRLPITKTYRKILLVPITLQDDGGTAVTAKVADKDPSRGPLVKLFDGTGDSVAGVIDVARMKGY